MSEGLKPCPFCGGEAVLHEITPHKHSIATFMPDHLGSWVVECGCGIGLIDEKRGGVITRWNRRAPSVPDGVVVSRETMQHIINALYRKDNTDSHAFAAELEARLAAAPQNAAPQENSHGSAHKDRDVLPAGAAPDSGMTREQIEEWREMLIDPAPWASEKQRAKAVNTLCDLVLRAKGNHANRNPTGAAPSREDSR